MEAYTGFAKVYDLFMDNTPYGQWATFIQERLKEQNITKGIVADLGCGTGKMTRLLADMGYDMIGIDLSVEMLEIAMEQQRNDDKGILYLCQDMTELELYGTVGAVVSCCDCINYITEEEDLIEVIKLVNNYLDPGGLFFFDFNTEYKYKQILGDKTFAENQEESSFIWENYYDDDQKINEYDVTIFARQEEGLYEKFQETHYQRAYTLEQIKKIIELGGMELVAVYDDYQLKEPHEQSERICVIAREVGKQNS